MSDLDMYRTLLAWTQGRPVPSGEALSLPRSDHRDTLVLAFVRMAGEALPWGFAAGHPGETPRYYVIPEPRNLDLAAQLGAALAAELLPHVGHPEHAAEGSFDPSARQLWLPGRGHLDLLHLISLRFIRARKGDPTRTATLRALARAAGFLFREASRPGQHRVIDASACLRDHHVFPAEPARCAHLGYLLAWLATPGDRSARQEAARQAELLSVGDTIDPTHERDLLEDAVKTWGKHPENRDQAAAAIEAVLLPELARRWRWACEAWELTRDDPRPCNPELDALSDLGRDEFGWQYLRTERELLEAPVEDEVFVTNPETDHAAAAVSRYFAQVYASNLRDGHLPHGDSAQAVEALASGNAIAGRLVRVEERKEGRAQHILWTVEAPASDLCRLRVGNTVCPLGASGRTASLRTIEVEGKIRRFTLEITGWKRARDGLLSAGDRRLQGKAITLLPCVDAFFAKKRSQQAWKAEGPGAWLSHKGAAPGAGPLPDGASLLRLVTSLAASGR